VGTLGTWRRRPDSSNPDSHVSKTKGEKKKKIQVDILCFGLKSQKGRSKTTE